MVNIEVIPSMTLLGLARPFVPALEPGANGPQVISQLWAEVSQVFFGLASTRDDYPVGVGAMWLADPQVTSSMIYFAGYKVQEVPADFGSLQVLEIAEGEYATVKHSDGMESLPQTIREFYSEALPKSAQQRRDGYDLELYYQTGAPDFSSSVIIAAPVE